MKKLLMNYVRFQSPSQIFCQIHMKSKLGLFKKKISGLVGSMDSLYKFLHRKVNQNHQMLSSCAFCQDFLVSKHYILHTTFCCILDMRANIDSESNIIYKAMEFFQTSNVLYLNQKISKIRAKNIPDNLTKSHVQCRMIFIQN